MMNATRTTLVALIAMALGAAHALPVVQKTLPLGNNTQGIATDPGLARVFITNFNDGTGTAVNVNALTVDDTGSPVSNGSTISVLTTSVNDTPGFSGEQANQAVFDNASLTPLGSVTVTDPDIETATVTVTILNGGNRGDFLPANPACVSTHGAGESFGKWRIQPAAQNCPLAPDTDYFVNVRLVDALPEDCGYQPECYIGLNSIFTN